MISPNEHVGPLLFNDAPYRNVVVTDPNAILHCEQYSGAGGGSTGGEMAYQELGRKVHIVAINHNKDAIATQNLNHGRNLNLRTGVEDVTPRYVFQGKTIHILVTSPSCVFFSSARGGTPVNPQERTSCWQSYRTLCSERPLGMLLENVPEFEDYGPCVQMRDDRGAPLFLRNVGTEKKTKWVRCTAPGLFRPKQMNIRTWWAELEKLGLRPAFTPNPKRKKVTFQKYVRKIRRRGYDCEWRVLNCANYGVPSTRRRFFLWAVRRGCGMRIVWPKPTHAEPDAYGRVPVGLLPWEPAARYINWSVRGTSIFTRPRPLKPKTIRRIIAGLKKYGLRLTTVDETGATVPGPYIAVSAPGDHPSPGVEAKPFFVKYRGSNTSASVDAPAPTITASGTHLGLVEPFIMQMNHGGSSDTGAHRSRSVQSPAPTICGNRGELGLCSSYLLPEVKPGLQVANAISNPDLNAFLMSQQSGGVARPVSCPAPTIATRGAIHLFEAEIMWHAQNPGNGYPTVEIDGKRYPIDILHRMLDTPELSALQSFPASYRFAGNKTSAVKQIGNALPPLMARALIKAFWSQNENVGVAPTWEQYAKAA